VAALGRTAAGAFGKYLFVVRGFRRLRMLAPDGNRTATLSTLMALGGSYQMATRLTPPSAQRHRRTQPTPRTDECCHVSRQSAVTESYLLRSRRRVCVCRMRRGSSRRHLAADTQYVGRVTDPLQPTNRRLRLRGRCSMRRQVLVEQWTVAESCCVRVQEKGIFWGSTGFRRTFQSTSRLMIGPTDLKVPLPYLSR
jgi:hypothetical protein